MTTDARPRVVGSLALVVLVALSGCLGGAVPSEPTTETPSTTTAAPTSTTTANWSTDLPPKVEIETGVLRDEAWEDVWENSTAFEVPAEYVSLTIRRIEEGGETYAVATNCSSYREPMEYDYWDSPGWDVATNRTHNLSEWDVFQVANVDTGEVVATHEFDRTPANCEPPIPAGDGGEPTDG